MDSRRCSVFVVLCAVVLCLCLCRGFNSVSDVRKLGIFWEDVRSSVEREYGDRNIWG